MPPIHGYVAVPCTSAAWWGAFVGFFVGLLVGILACAPMTSERSPREAAPEGPWKTVSPTEYAGAANPYAKDWIVRADTRPGHSAIVGTEAEALAVRDALNRVWAASQPPTEGP